MKCKFIIVRKYTDSYFNNSYVDVPFIFPEKINHYGFAQTLLDGNLSEIHTAGYCELYETGFIVSGSADTIGYGIKYNSQEILNKWYTTPSTYYSYNS